MRKSFTYRSKPRALQNRHAAVLISVLYVLQPVSLIEAGELLWSQNPGAYERHLQRRYNNPLFPPNRQRVTLQELRSARARDQANAAAVRQEFYSFVRELDLPDDFMTLTEFNTLRKRTEDLHERALAVGGDVSDVVNGLIGLRKVLIQSVQEGASNNPDALSAIQKAESRYQAYARWAHIPVVMQNIQDMFPGEELVPALLTEDPDTIRTVMGGLDDRIKKIVREEAINLVLQVAAEGKAIPRIGEKLDALGVKAKVEPK